MKNKITVLFLALSLGAFAQTEISLEKCYELVNTNYPLAKQGDLLSQKNDLETAVIEKSKLPVFDLSAQATYQSDVTHVPLELPNMSIPSPNKDQYRANLTVNQLIYGGGVIDLSLDAKRHELKTQQKELEVSLFQLKKKINQLYFSVLLLQEKEGLLLANKEKLQARLKEVKAGIKYGVLLASSDDVLEAEMLKIDQNISSLNLNKASLISSLSQLVGEQISTTDNFKNPELATDTSTTLNRPELELFQLKKQQIDLTHKVMEKKNMPKLFGFGMGGYGNPGLNMLDNTFQPYYMVGLKLKWNVFDWNKSKTQRQALLLNKEIIANQEEVFKFNTNIELTQQQAEIDKIGALISSDKTIIELRKKIVKSANSQLKNGVITSSSYITELTNLFEAENNLNTHQIQLLLAKANYKITQGN